MRIIFQALLLLVLLLPSGGTEDSLKDITVPRILAIRGRKRAPLSCRSTVKISNCDFYKTVKIHRKMHLQFLASYVQEKQCKLKSIEYKWIIDTDKGPHPQSPNYQKKESLQIEPYVLDLGTSRIIVKVTQHLTEIYKSTISTHCDIVVITDKPIPLITGGTFRTVESGKTFLVEAKESIDLDVWRAEKKTFYYKWTCLETSTEFCNSSLDNKPSIKVPSKYAVDGTNFTFNLSIKKSGGVWQSCSQTIMIKANTEPLSIRCLENCPPEFLTTDSTKEIVLKAECSNCEDETFKWYYLGLEITNSYRLAIPPNTLETGNMTTVTVQRLVKEGIASIDITTATSPEIKNCSANPTTGIALNTLFSVNCSSEPLAYFKIYSNINNKDIFLTHGAALGSSRFLLPKGSKIEVRVIDENGLEAFETVNIDVTAYVTNHSNLHPLVHKYFSKKSNTSIIKIIKEERFEEAFQIMLCLVKELSIALDVNTGARDPVLQMHKAILGHLHELPVLTLDDVNKIGLLTNMILESYVQELDISIASTSSELAKYLSGATLKILEAQYFPRQLDDYVREAASNFVACAEICTKNHILQISRKANATDIKEDDEHLEEFTDYDQKNKEDNTRELLAKSIDILWYICNEGLQALAITKDDDLVSASFSTDTMNVSYTSREGPKLVKYPIVSQGLSLNVSMDLYKIINKISTQIYSSSRNPYWWTKQITYTPTNVAYVEFINKANKEVIKSFKESYAVEFDTEHSVIKNLEPHESFTPAEYEEDRILLTMPNFRKEDQVRIHRIDARAKQSYFIVFTGLKKTDFFNIIIKDFEKPMLADFSGATEISEKKNIIFQPYTKDYDGWHYMAIMPSSKMVAANQLLRYFKYNVSVISINCQTWDTELNQWEPGLETSISPDLKKVICKYNKSSVALGVVARMGRIRTEPSRLRKHYVLPIVEHFIIFAWSILVLLLYMLFIIYARLTLKPKVVERDLYFLGDVFRSHRYAYLIIVKTGSRLGAGTTSNVMIKLIGANAESDEHVLNYPDPELLILQRKNEDWFSLATEVYLGEIKSIKIWFDSIGCKPSWYCSEIEVYDMQNKLYWYFHVSRWFKILKMKSVLVTVEPCDREGYKITDKIWNKINISFDGVHIFSVFSNDHFHVSPFRRLNVVLSILFQIFALNIIACGIPRRDPSDAFDISVRSTRLIIMAVAGTMSGFISFCYHSTIIWVFRRSEMNYPPPLGHGKGARKRFSRRVVMICWIFVCANIMLCSILILESVFWVSHMRSLLWLGGCAVAICTYIILEYASLCLVNCYRKRLSRTQYISNTVFGILTYIERQRTTLYNKFGDSILRPYLRHLYEPLNEDHITEVKKREKSRALILVFMEDIILFIMYIIVLQAIIWLHRDTAAAHNSNQQVMYLCQGENSHKLLGDVKTPVGFNEYIGESLIPIIQHPPLNFSEESPECKKMSRDLSNMLIGVMRMRQHRSREIACELASLVGLVNISCVPEYTNQPEDRSFARNWKPLDEKENDTHPLSKNWKYVSPSKDGAGTIFGEITIYKGGGYIAPLGMTFNNSIWNYYYILENDWIDRATRSTMIEFLMYVANVNLFSFVTIKFERSATGFLYKDVHVQTARLLYEPDDLEVQCIILGFAVAVIILIIIKKFTGERKLKLVYLWHAVDMIIVIAAIGCVIFYVHTSCLVEEYMDKLEARQNYEFVDYFYLTRADTGLTIAACLMVVLATVRMWKLLRFFIIFRVMENTLRFSAKNIFAVFAWHVLSLIMFCCSATSGELAFGGIYRACMALITETLSFNEEIQFVLRTPIDYLHFSVSHLWLALIIKYLYIVSILFAYLAARYATYKDYKLKIYFKDQFVYYSNLSKARLKHLRLRGGLDINYEDDEELRKVYPNVDSQRYSGYRSIAKNKLTAMQLVTRCALRNILKPEKKLQLQNEDAELMKYTLGCIYSKPSARKDRFLVTKHKKGVKIIDDERFIKMEIVTQNLLNEQTRRERTKDLCDHQLSKLRLINDSLKLHLGVVNHIRIRT